MAFAIENNYEKYYPLHDCIDVTTDDLREDVKSSPMKKTEVPNFFRLLGLNSHTSGGSFVVECLSRKSNLKDRLNGKKRFFATPSLYFFAFDRSKPYRVAHNTKRL